MKHPSALMFFFLSKSFFFGNAEHGFVDVQGLTAQMVSLSSAWKFLGQRPDLSQNHPPLVASEVNPQ